MVGLFILDVLLGKECYVYAALHDGFDQSSPPAFFLAYSLVRASLGKGGLVLGDVTARGRVQVSPNRERVETRLCFDIQYP